MNTESEIQNGANSSARHSPHHDHRFHGRIARLPKNIRDQLCQMILDGVPYKYIPAGLGEHGKGLDQQLISKWKKRGGYDAWLRDQQRLDDCRSRIELLRDASTQDPGTDTYQASPKIAIALLSEALLELGPDGIRKSLAEDPRNTFRLLNSLARLISGGLRCEKHLLETAAQGIQLETKPNPASAGLSPKASGTILQDYV